MQNELPEWAKLCADEIIGDYLDLSETRSGQLSRLVAKSLVAAERRGIERAAKGLQEARDRWNESQDKDSFDHLGNTIDAAIRQLGETT